MTSRSTVTGGCSHAADRIAAEANRSDAQERAVAKRDDLTTRYTAFDSFAALTHAGLDDGYSPTLSRAETRPLADAFDVAMCAYGSTVRAWRGSN